MASLLGYGKGGIVSQDVFLKMAQELYILLLFSVTCSKVHGLGFGGSQGPMFRG